MNDPNRCRGIMYLILFPGIGFFAAGASRQHPDLLMILFCTIGAVLCVAGLVWGFKKIRCPYCGWPLNQRITYTRVCPHCNKRIG